MQRRKTRIQPVDDTTSHILSLRDKRGLTDNVIDDYKGMLGTFEWQYVTATTLLSTLNTYSVE